MSNEGEPKIPRPERQPEILDIVSIDGRWGQVAAGAAAGFSTSIRWLDDKEPGLERVNLNQYKLAEFINRPVFMAGNLLTPDHLERIHYGAEQAEKPQLKLQVRVFGKFAKK